MGEIGEDASFYAKSWNGWKGFWSDRFAYLDNYTKFVKDKPLPAWSDSDVEAFIASDPVHGPTLKTAREAAKYGFVGATIGAVSSAGVAWKYSKSPHGAVLAFGAGAVCGVTFGIEFASHALQLYRLDTMTAQTKFMEWWETKSASRS
ncbi:succinate dehydrogenase subunit 6, mitochondrial [Silene latifolia]|uniref:succinate dehydrogenase subunit 6, mitochondrial n=1 Tax=Silene latifolia TaxID=37657 RepID=UPI003D775DFF